MVRRLLRVTMLLAVAFSMPVAVALGDPQTDALTASYNALKIAMSAGGVTAAPGTGVVVEQNEAPLNPSGPTPYQYLPDPTQFSKVTFTDESGGGATSTHATQVGYSLYYYDSGGTQSDCYNEASWIPNVLKFQSLSLPAAPPSNDPVVGNFSWAGGYGTAAYDNDVLRRFDYMIDQYNLVEVVGVNNGAGSAIPALLASSYNSIAVGLSNGQSSTGPVPPGDVDGPGRSKPDIVAPDGEVSYVVPDVTAAAAILEQVARKMSLTSGTNAAVIKAILLAGADKTPLPSWSHTSTQPLDPQYGAGQLNFLSAYQIMAAGPQLSGLTVSASTGWSYGAVFPSNSAGSTQTYYFDVPSGQPFDLSALLTWQRNLTYAPSGSALVFTPSLATIDLNLYQASNFTLGSLVASSSSSIDNVQYVFDRAIAPGEYALKVARTDMLSGSWSYALAWQTQAVPQWAAANGSWNVGANWSGAAAPSGVGYEAYFGGPTTSGVSVTLDSPQTIGQLTLGNSASTSAGYTFSAGSAGTLTFSNSGSNALLTITSGSHAISAPVILASNVTIAPALGAAVNISGNISGTGGSRVLTVNGSGVLALSGSNTFSGGAVITAGTLQIGAGGASGTPGAGPITDYGTLAVNRSDTYSLSTSISGTGGIVQLGPGTTVLAVSNSYTGVTTIRGGALRPVAAGALPATGSLTLAGGVLESNGTFTRNVSSSGANTVAWSAAGGGFAANGGLLVVNLFNNGQMLAWTGSGIQGPLMFGSATANNETAFFNPINLNGADRTIQTTQGQGGDYTAIFGGISNSAGTAGVVKTGGGLLVMDGNNTYNGKTTISAGTLAISSAANYGSGGIAFSGSGGGVLEVTGSVSLLLSSAVALNQNGTIQQNDAGLVNLAGTISGSGNLIKTGSGVLELSGTNSYTGETIVTGGTLLALNSMALSSGGLIIGANAPSLFGDILPATSLSNAADLSGPISATSDELSLLPAANPTSSAIVPNIPTANVNAVPEPGSLILVVVALGGGALLHARRDFRTALESRLYTCKPASKSDSPGDKQR
jgi:autotransporter-associated beta strand protein